MPTTIIIAAALAVLISTAAQAESAMAPIDDHGQTITGHMPFEETATTDEKIEWLRRQSTAHCADTSYHLESTSSGLACIRKAR